MRIFLFLIFFLLAFSSFPQVRIDATPKDGILLNEGWKIIAGDNAQFSDAQYNDVNWQAVNPSLDIHEIPLLWKNNIIWLRMHFRIENRISDELAMMVTQTGASEIFLNGRLIKRIGIIETSANDTKAYDPSGKPILLENLKEKDNVIAVRYALQPNVKYSVHINRVNPLFIAYIAHLDYAVENYKNANIGSATSNFFRIGVFLIFLILHLAFYLYYPPQKANLYFSIYSLLALIFEITQFNTPRFIENIYNALYIQFSVFHLAYIILLTALYELLNRKRGINYWTLVVLTVGEILFDRFTYKTGDSINVYVISNLVTLEIVRISLSALRHKQRGAWIIAAGATSFMVFWGIFVAGRYFHFQYEPLTKIYGYGDLLSNLALLSMPIATSVYLALEFAFTNSELQKKFAEVQTLSIRTIEQEKEKQQILASQNELLEKQVAERTHKLKESLENLESTQAQLIQSEKMASLGELTAGIAHEIQNPLNFVNNFSDVNTELIDEAKQELDKGNTNETKTILDDIKENEQKINHHGKRADAIVKGMLQHSRSNSGIKEPTNINALADEYLRLAYHGLRAKDKSFNATMKTDFDESIGKINIIPQDIGRVVLNLINNAFYVVDEKKKQQPDFEPIVTVTTRSVKPPSGGLGAEIKVSDNGNGIPPKILDKIFQPFFTTKPTGEGTGLGLSLSYDIVKAHGGEFKVETKEGEGSTFIINLPI